MNPLFAGFWRRGAALLVDSLILAIPQTGVNLALASSPNAALLVNIVIGLAYFAGFHASPRQATPGKMAFGIKVTDLAGARIGPGRAVARFFATWLSALVLGVGYLLAAFTGRKQALHDILCKTLVVGQAATPEQVAEGGTTMPLTTGVKLLMAVWLVVPFVGIVAAVFIPVYQDRALRAHLTNAIVQAEPFKKEVADALMARRAVPAGERRIDSPYVERVAIEGDGQITITLSRERLKGGQVFLAPLVSRGGPLEWRCWSEGVRQALMPAVCRT
jgi:uncharacterized RDD family membrane protein YckC